MVIHVMNDHQINDNCFNEPFAVSPFKSLYWDMHGLIFETSIWLLAGSTRLVSRNKENENLSWEKKSQTKHRWHSIVLKTTPKTNSHSNQDSRENEFFWTHKTWKKFKLKSDNQIGISIERLPEKYSVKPNTIRMNPLDFDQNERNTQYTAPYIQKPQRLWHLRTSLVRSWFKFPQNLNRDLNEAICQSDQTLCIFW